MTTKPDAPPDDPTWHKRDFTHSETVTDDSLFVIGYVFAVFYGVLLGLFLAAVLTAIGWWWSR